VQEDLDVEWLHSSVCICISDLRNVHWCSVFILPLTFGAPSLLGIGGRTTSSQSQGSTSNNQAGDDAVDNSGAPTNMCDVFSNVAIDPKKDKTLIVTVYLLEEHIFNPQNMAESH
jgi:hypothetical protein